MTAFGEMERERRFDRHGKHSTNFVPRPSSDVLEYSAAHGRKKYFLAGTKLDDESRVYMLSVPRRALLRAIVFLVENVIELRVSSLRE